MPSDLTTNFDFVRTLVRNRSGIVLGAEKDYLIQARLSTLSRKEGFDSIHELLDQTQALLDPLDANGQNVLREKVVEAMTTNETSFFRDQHPFECLRTHLLPELLQRRAAERSLKIWSAACSTGQEPYSVAMVLEEAFPELRDWHVQLIASDLSAGCLDQARQGRYSQMEVGRGLPAPRLAKFFSRRGLDWVIHEDLRRMIDFRQLNLLNHDLELALPPMDIVFLRNVLIYFDKETSQQILGCIRRVLRPDGYLFLGGAETTLFLDDAFERVPLNQAGCYRLKLPSPTSPTRSIHDALS